MDNYYVYLAGGMEGLSWEQQNEWRDKICFSLNNLAETYNAPYNIIVCCPPKYFNFEIKKHDNEREVMEFDLNKVRHSDLVIVNFTYKPISLGTMAEITTAYEHKIPILGICEDETVFANLHPWQKEMCLRIFDSIDKIINYIAWFYLL